MKRLENKVAIITGASSGIGRASALLFAKEGASLVVGARRQSLLDELVAQIEHAGGQAIAVAGDVTSGDHARTLVDTAVSEYGRLDIAFNNAGTLGALKAVTDMSAEEWHETMDTNLTSAFLGAKYQIEAMRGTGGGAIVFTSSFVGYTAGGLPGMAAYAASKAGLVGMTQSLASEYGKDGIRVNALLPGGTDTAMAPDTEDGRAYVRELHALHRIAEPDEIARAALFLASDEASFVTGHAMLADGGVSIHLR